MNKRTIERTMFYGAKAPIFRNAEELRFNMTDAEKVLWGELRKNKLKGYRFKAQHPLSQFIVDFYCHKAGLVIEVDGEIHNDTDQKEYDENRTFEIEKLGLKVIRFKNEEVYDNIDEVIKKIKDELANTRR